MVLAICREFNVNKIWLIEGHGEMFEDDDMEFARAVNRVMFGESEFARKVFKLFGKLSLEEWNKLEEIARSLVDDKKKRPTNNRLLFCFVMTINSTARKRRCGVYF